MTNERLVQATQKVGAAEQSPAREPGQTAKSSNSQTNRTLDENATAVTKVTLVYVDSESRNGNAYGTASNDAVTVGRVQVNIVACHVVTQT
jgi:hypothetical protein